MVEILLATNVWKRLSSLLRYFKTEVLSVQKTESSWTTSSAFNNDCQDSCCQLQLGNGHSFQWRNPGFAEQKGDVDVVLLI